MIPFRVFVILLIIGISVYSVSIQTESSHLYWKHSPNIKQQQQKLLIHESKTTRYQNGNITQLNPKYYHPFDLNFGYTSTKDESKNRTVRPRKILQPNGNGTCPSGFRLDRHKICREVWRERKVRVK